MGLYLVERSIAVQAPADRVHRLIDDFHAWPQWSPWEDLDPQLQRTYDGAADGVGARYAWRGNRKAGEGAMEIVGSTPERIDLALRFDKPFRSTSDVAFLLVERGPATEVTWRMTGEQKGLQAVFGKLVPMDKLIGKDLDRGMSRLKTAAEANG